MNLDRIRPALVVVLGVLAISAAAASMEGSTATPSAGAGGGEGAGSGESAGVGYSDSPPAQTTSAAGYDFWNWLRPTLALLFGGGALVYLCYVAREIWRDGIDGIRQVLVHAITTVIPAGLAYIIMFGPHVLQWSNAPMEPPSSSATPEHSQGGGSSSTEAVDTATQAMPALLLILGIVVVLAVAVLVLKNMLDDEGDGPAVPTGSGTDGERDLSGPVHVDTTTSMADVDATNDVYRAWRELASSVDGVDLRTHTPTEVADRAGERGFDRQAVQTLTDLFEEVRYGQQPPTSERESRARSALDRLLSGRESR